MFFCGAFQDHGAYANVEELHFCGFASVIEVFVVFEVSWYRFVLVKLRGLPAASHHPPCCDSEAEVGEKCFRPE